MSGERDYTIQIINLSECDDIKKKHYIDTCFFGWANLEGWNPGKYDMATYLQTFPEAFYVLNVVENEGEEGELKLDPAVVIIVPYNKTTKQIAIGAYISEKSKYRGKGLAYKLWRHVLARVEELCPLSDKHLFAVPEQMATYARSDFHPTYNVIHYQITTRQRYGPFRVAIEDIVVGEELKEIALIYLRDHYSVGFAKFLDLMSGKENVHVNVAISVMEGELKIVGVGMARPLSDGISYRYSIVTNHDFLGVADDLFKNLNRYLAEENLVVIDTKEGCKQQLAFESYATKEEEKGRHWTTAMSFYASPEEKEREGTVVVSAEPSLEMSFKGL